MQNGDSAIHIVSDLVLGMEGELEESTANDSTGADQPPSDDAPSSPHVHFSTEPDQMLLFDSLTSSVEENQDDDKECAEKEWMTHHRQSSLSNQPVARGGSMSSGF